MREQEHAALTGAIAALHTRFSEWPRDLRNALFELGLEAHETQCVGVATVAEIFTQ
jgi:hypothetical protein